MRAFRTICREIHERGYAVLLSPFLSVLIGMMVMSVPVNAQAHEALLSNMDAAYDDGEFEESEQVEDPYNSSQGLRVPGEEPTGTQLSQALDSYLSQNADATGVPGIAVAIVDGQRVRYETTLGDCSSAENTFIIGSLSKSITAVAVMQLVEQGLVNLDDPISTYMSDLQLPDEVTARALLNQTSGFGYYESLADARVGDTLGSFSYANANYDLLGRLIETVSGQDYGTYVQNHVFRPLNMMQASAGSAASLMSSTATPGHRSWFGVPVADGFVHALGDDSWGNSASGYVRASLKDMEAYLMMYLNSGSGVLDADSVHQMVFSRVPDTSGDTYYGMGWTTYAWSDGELVMSHDGQVENYVARMCIIPDRDLGIVVLGDANDELGGNEAFFSLADDIVSIAVGGQPSGVNPSERIEQHIYTNATYIAVLIACMLLVIYALRSNWQRWRLFSSIAIHVGTPLFLLAFPRIFEQMRWRDFFDFYPDQSVVVLMCCGLLIAGGVVKLIRFYRHTKQEML